MFYSVWHLTRFRYDAPVSESLMEVRMQPRTEGPQRCLSFQLSMEPRAQINVYRDYLGNSVHHFDVPGKHTQLRIVADALVEVQPQPDPPERLEPEAWAQLDQMVAAGDFWELLMPSHFAQSTAPLEDLIAQLDVVRRDDPLTLLRELNRAVYTWIEYVPKSTRVDSPVEVAIAARKGVCQDFAHILTALARHVRIPCRYVSGYLYHSSENPDRSIAGASHAWVEALLPGLGWVGFDPTNNLVTGERHIRTAIGRDYSDVPPTKGIYKGEAASELTVSVLVTPSGAPPPPEADMGMPQEWVAAVENEALEAQQQQQQQQQ